jgi:exopolysaccharide biosynthesis operon protein EpsL
LRGDKETYTGQCGRGVRAGLTMALLAGSMQVAYGQLSDVLNVTTKLDMKYDSNIFDLPPDADTAALIGRSSAGTFVYTEQADLVFDKTVSLQHFKVDLSASHQSFQDFHYLDFSALNYVADWQWQLAPRLSGTIGASRQEQLGDYADFQEYSVRNLETANEEHFTFDMIGTTHWHLVGGVARYSLDNPDAFTQVGSFVENSGELGVKYVASSGNDISLVFRDAVGNFNRDAQVDGLLDNHYTLRRVRLVADYQLSGHTTMQALVGYSDRRSGDFAQRDFQGPIGSVSLDWTPTGKTEMTLSYVHDLIDYEEDTSSYYLTNILRFTPVWHATSKLSVSGVFEAGYDSFRQPIQPTPELRADKVFNASLKLEYKPLRSVALSLYGQWRKRISNTSTYGYSGTVVGVTGSFTF